MKKRKYTKRQLSEISFHDQWGNTTEAEAIDVFKCFTAETSVDFQLAERLLGDFKNRKILDLGCGLGEASVYFALNGAKVVALDISPGMLDCARKLATKYSMVKKVRFIEAPAEKLPFKPETFDLIFGGNVLHHVDLPQVSREIKRVLKKGGKAVFIEPLGYNPVIQIYRKMAGDIRTKMERPFTFSEIRKLGKGFRRVAHTEQQLFTTLIFVWFFVGERLNPSRVRYWKRIIEEGERYARPFKVLAKIDRLVLRIPFLKMLCWNTVVELAK